MAFRVELVSPEGSVFTGEATMVLARTAEGEIAFQQGHVPFIGVLVGTGPVKVWLVDGTVVPVAVHSGFVQVSGDAVTILSDVAELPDAIDVARAEAARDRARAVLQGEPHDEAALAAQTRANLRLQVAGRPTAGAAH
jgi:F-type H+-transporting ATPase subunit epsilon